MAREITPSEGEQPMLSFKESVILNLQRNKGIMQDNIEACKQAIILIDKAIEQAEANNDAMAFAETMQKLQRFQSQR